MEQARSTLMLLDLPNTERPMAHGAPLIAALLSIEGIELIGEWLTNSNHKVSGLHKLGRWLLGRIGQITEKSIFLENPLYQSNRQYSSRELKNFDFLLN